MKTDVLIVGTGCSGLYHALNLPENLNILMITKSDLESSDSFLAQGGICMWKDPEDYESFFEDTLRAGHYENDRESVDIMIKSSPDVLKDLLAVGVDFHREENGELSYTREGAHSEKRILYHEDETGKEITSKLLSAVKKRKNITLLEYTTLLDILCENNVCCGAVIRNADGEIDTVQAEYVILATGGVGGLYRHSTNFPHLTGDALAIAQKHNVELLHPEYVQIHPTTLYTAEDAKNGGERSFLISESVRGEGAKLYDKNMNRFVDELLPRDVVSAAIYRQMEIDHTDHVWADLRPIPEKELREHFPNIVEHCRQMGYDVFRECIPIVPAQHYFMGGIKVDHYSKTTMDRLYAVGETACNGVHGKNRLASNSLLESLVFAKRAAKQITEELSQQQSPEIRSYKNAKREQIFRKLEKNIKRSDYENGEKLALEYRNLAYSAITHRSAAQ